MKAELHFSILVGVDDIDNGETWEELHRYLEAIPGYRVHSLEDTFEGY